MYDPESRSYVERDNGIHQNASRETFRDLKPVFDKHHGSVTPGNSSQVTDAAAALLLMEEEKAKSLGLPIAGYVGEYADYGYEPACMGLAPVGAIARILSKARLTLKEVSLFEINEAFASIVLAIVRTLDSPSLMEHKFGRYGLAERLGEIPLDDLNPHGGAIALGHPVGVSGLRLAMTALRELKRRNADRALIMGLVHDVFPDESFEDDVMRFCRHLAQQNSESMGLAKIAIELARDVGLAQARNVERMANSSLMLGPSYLENIERHIQGLGSKRDKE